MNQEFDEIRPYHDEELPAIYEELIADPAFRQVAEAALPGIPFEALANQMRACKTKQEFQVNICYDILKRIIREATLGVTFDNSAQPERGGAYTYVSNHRDIVLDSGFLSLMLVEQGQNTVEIAIGDNLLIYPWIKKLVRINKSFIVQRALTMRQMLESSARMSRREGRAKDSNDRTQESILKMMAMAGEGDIISRLKEMNIVPLAISYEYDPCDFLKAKEFQQKRDNPNYQKSPADDLLNMQVGITGYKGRVMFRFAPSINPFLDELGQREKDKAAQFSAIASEIDRRIHQNYELYSGNFVAYDLLLGMQRFANNYSAGEKAVFEQYIAGQMAKIDLTKKDEAFLYRKLLEMYANPVINHLESIKA